MKLTTTISLVLLATTSIAAADDFPPATRIGKVANWLLDVKENYANDGRGSIDANECSSALAALKDKGGTDTSHNQVLAKFGAKREDKPAGAYIVTTPIAEAICKEATLYKTVLKDYRLFLTMAMEVWQLEDTTLGPGIAEASVQRASECSAAVKTMIASGVPTSFPYVMEDRDNKVLTKTVADIEPNLCQATLKLAQKYTQKLEDEERERNARLTKAGITGDKMYWWKHYDGNVFTAGGREPDLAGYGKASVWFAYTYSSNPDINGNHLFSVRRYQFSGTKLTKQTEKTYKKPLSFKNAIGSVMK